jgi:hypothetical protein
VIPADEARAAAVRVRETHELLAGHPADPEVGDLWALVSGVDDWTMLVEEVWTDVIGHGPAHVREPISVQAFVAVWRPVYRAAWFAQ